MATFEVRDSGVGIASEDLERISSRSSARERGASSEGAPARPHHRSHADRPDGRRAERTQHAGEGSNSSCACSCPSAQAAQRTAVQDLDISGYAVRAAA